LVKSQKALIGLIKPQAKRSRPAPFRLEKGLYEAWGLDFAEKMGEKSFWGGKPGFKGLALKAGH
jgi:hypothetical protein